MQAELHEPKLGTLVLGCDPFVVASIQVGSPAIRVNTRDVALGDGTLDDTRYMGARAITVALRLKNGGVCGGETMQALIDAVTPYMHASRRPILTWQLAGSEDVRAATVRGVAWPYTFAAPKALVLPLQFTVPSGEIMAGAAGGASAAICETIIPTADVEAGRTYDLTFDRSYPPSTPVGSRTIMNPGNHDAHWKLTIFGPVTNPSWTVNGVEMEFTGLTLLAGQNLTISTRRRTILFDDNPADSRYNLVNYTDWGWEDLVLGPGENVVRFAGGGLSAATSAQLCYTPTFI